MVTAAPRLDRRLRQALRLCAETNATAAEVRRQLVVCARDLDLPPPSYEHVRRLVEEHRRKRRLSGPTMGELARDVAFRARPVGELYDAIAGGSERAV